MVRPSIDFPHVSAFAAVQVSVPSGHAMHEDVAANKRQLAERL